MLINSSTYRVFSAFIFLLLLISCAETGQQPGAEDDVLAIEQMSAERAEAFNNGDAATIARYFTEDGILMAPGMPATSGREAVEAYYQQIFDTYETGLTSYYEEVKVSGDLAIGMGIAEVTLRPYDGGDTVESVSKYINILERQQDGSWLTTHDIWNDN